VRARSGPLRTRTGAILALLVAASAAQAAPGGWALCAPGPLIPARPPFEGEPGEPDAYQVAADEASLEGGGVSTLRGNVQVVRGERQLQADTVIYNELEELIDASGNVRFWDQDLYLTGEQARIELASDAGSLEQARFVLAGEHGRGQAERIELRGSELVRAQRATYTTCDPGREDWLLSASRIELDRAAGVGSARNVVVRLKGVPVFYSPYLTFPLSDERKSGFLAPRARFSGASGPEITVPYYFNLAPNRDATLAARAMADRGVQVQGEFRYLTARSSGQLNLELLPLDREIDEARSLVHFRHATRLAPRWNLDTRFDWVSDPRYFEDLGTELAVSSRSFLEQRADLSYSSEDWWLLARVQSFQTVDDSLATTARPYHRLPQLRLASRRPERDRALNLGLDAELVRFERSAGVTGTRLDLRPVLSYPVRTPGTFLVPRLALRYTGYRLAGTAPGADDAPSRLLPTLSLDGGLIFERDLALGGRSLLQTLEPRLFYLLVPFDDQRALPVFDTGRYTFGYGQLFRDDRFSGADRVGDAHQVTLAVTTRLLTATGRELARLSAGQIRYLRDRKVTLPGDPVERTRSSSYVAELRARPSAPWEVSGEFLWDPHQERTDRSALALRYRPDRLRVLNVSYRFVRDAAEQADVSFAWPLAGSWRTVGRWSYAPAENQLLEGVLGLEYESCCWGLRVIGRRYLSDTTGNHTAALFLQLQLKGLAGIGDKALDFLREGIPGYERQF